MKKFIKENVKVLVSIIVTAMVVSATTVFAYSLMANDVSFTPVDNGWDVNNVGSALDDLRLKAGELSTNFSTNEKVIGKWIDGKLLYQKTITYINKTVSETSTYTLIKDSNINLVNAFGYVTENNHKYIFPEGGGRIEQQPDSSIIVKSLDNHTFTGNGYITIQYTKTID